MTEARGRDDRLVDVARVHADSSEQASLAEILSVINECRRDLDIANPAALPELIERLTRQRLSDPIVPKGTRFSLHADTMTADAG